MVPSHHLAELASVIESRQATLFTGAGFSAEARDREGRTVPDTRQMACDLWAMLFGDEHMDDSSLADLYDAALLRVPERLSEYVQRRLQIGDAKLPETFAAWFSAPWRRIYTLNVDDLEAAVTRQFDLPRRLVSISAVAPEERPQPDALEVVHLNGIAGGDPGLVTFSTMQYAARLCTSDREYERLVEDLRSGPFVFVGTTLDEAVLWKHIQLERQAAPPPEFPDRADHDRGRREEPARHAHSFLIAPSLSRARQILLASHDIHWIPATASHIAGSVLARL